jgi:hypothetical protein
MNLGWVFVFIGLIFLSSCAVQPQYEEIAQPEPSFFTSEISHDTIEGTHKLISIEIVQNQDDSFQRWQEYNELRIAQDRWEAVVEKPNHELEIDVDVEDDWLQCDRELIVYVEIENLGDVDEDVRVVVWNDNLLITSEKFVEVEQFHTRSVRYQFNLDDAPRGDYSINAEVFRDIDFDRRGGLKDAGEFEGRDSEQIHVAVCRT